MRKYWWGNIGDKMDRRMITYSFAIILQPTLSPTYTQTLNLYMPSKNNWYVELKLLNPEGGYKSYPEHLQEYLWKW